MAARGERVVIKGSERVDWWERIPEGETVWKAVLPDSMFGDWNPYRRTVWGDWVVDPRDYEVHLGEVYLNGKSFYEAQSLEDVLHPRKRQFSAHETWMNRRERILEQEMTIYQWYCKPEENQVIVYANFHGADPNRETVEVTHGPYLVDNNIFTSPFSLVNAAQGGAYVHNLICGFIQHYPVLDRATPYHFPHSTEILGTAVVYGADDRWYQNIFLGGEEAGVDYGTAWYDGCPVSAQEYVERVAQRGVGDLENFLPVPQPVYIDGNVYLHGAQGFKGEEHGCSISEDPKVRVSQEAEGLYLEITLPEAVFDVATEAVDTNRLGLVRIPEAAFEGVDARPMTLALDLLGSMRGEKPVPGPLQELRPGRNRICLWQRDSF